ncbi:RyR domain-containing protein [Hirschia litorea]|uniref:RyR domain-containing protein n=1 Tax=Hirschia litorea TaxID=1199156 RepID=A0ABW2IHT8_9PROT
MLVLLRIFLRRLEKLAFRKAAALYWLSFIGLSLLAFGAGVYGWWRWEFDAADAIYQLREVGSQNWQVFVETIQLSIKAIFASDIYVATSLAQMPLSLQIARLAGAVAFILMVGRFFLFALGGRASRVFLWARCDHDIVVGDHPLAFEYAKLQKRKVTLLCQTPNNENCFKPSKFIADDLKRCGAKRARRIIVAHNLDVETWSQAQEIASLYPNMEILAHFMDSWLLERVSKADPATKLKPFSLVAGVAREVMLAHPPYLLARRKKHAVQHIIIIGFGELGQALVREFLITSVSSNPLKMAVTIIDPQAKALAAEFHARHPGIKNAIDLSFVAGNLTLHSPTVESFIKQRCSEIPPCAVYIALSEDAQPLVTAVAMKDRAEREAWFDAPIFVNSRNGSGLRSVLQGSGLYGIENYNEIQVKEHAKYVSELKLVPFGSWRRGMDGTALLSPDYDTLARTFHETYLKTQTNTANISAIEHNWDYLEEEYRVSNRRVAAHMRATLDSAGFNLETWLEEGTSDGQPHSCVDLPRSIQVFDMDDVEELERLARLQHERWMLDRLLNGWRLGRLRDNNMRLHNHLVDYGQLDDSVKEQDRAMVRQIANLVQTD